jgi:phage replication O-like protein O
MKRPRFTAVPHEIVDVYLKDLSESQIKVLLVILRKTYGWNRETDAISFTQMSELTGLTRGTCSDAVKFLESLGIVKATRHSTEAKGLSSTTYEPDFEDDPPIRLDEQGVRVAEQAIRLDEQYKEDRKTTEDNKESPYPLFRRKRT